MNCDPVTHCSRIYLRTAADGGTGSEIMQLTAAPIVGGMIPAPLSSMFVIRAAHLLMRRRRAISDSRVQVESGSLWATKPKGEVK